MRLYRHSSVLDKIETGLKIIRKQGWLAFWHTLLNKLPKPPWRSSHQMGTAKKIMVDIGGTKYRITSDDNYLDHIRGRFDPDLVKLFRALENDWEIVLDIGANIGCTAILFGELANSVYAFEPSPSTFQFLIKNISESGRRNILLQNIALGNESGESTLTFDPSFRAGAFVSNQTQARVGHTVGKIIMRQLDEVVKSLNLPRIDFIKIDVEGFEGHEVRGATQTLATYRPVVVLELNHWCLNAFQRTSIPDFFDLLRSTFPILLAVDASNYMDLHNENDSHTVIFYHIVHLRFPNILAGFDEEKLKRFRSLYQHQFIMK